MTPLGIVLAALDALARAWLKVLGGLIALAVACWLLIR